MHDERTFNHPRPVPTAAPRRVTTPPMLGRRTLLSGLAAGFVASGLAGLAASHARAQDYPPTKGEMQGFVLLKERLTAPDTPFFDADGNARHLADFPDRVLLVNFWATWCAPCIREMPSISRLQDAFPQDEFLILTISQDRKGLEVAAPFMHEKLGIKNLAMFEDRRFKFGRSLGVRGLPSTFLIDRRGRLVGGVRGSVEWDSPDAKAMIQHLLRESI